MVTNLRPISSHCRDDLRTGFLRGLATLALVTSASVSAGTYCVHNAGELQAALVDVGNLGIANGHANTLLLTSGTFVATPTFFVNQTSGFEIDMSGGYDATCSTHDRTPGATKLDGGGVTQVLNVQTNGIFSLTHITIQNGLHNGSAGGGAQIYLAPPQPSSNPDAVVTLDDNIVRNNSTTYASGGLTVYGKGTLHFDNNLFVGNTAPNAAAWAISMDQGSVVYVSNNTMTGNTNTSTGAPTSSINSGGTIAAYLVNNISYANTGAYDFYIGVNTAQLFNNDYAALSGLVVASSSGNVIGIDPQFVGAGDYHLQATSPLLDIGLLSVPGGLPALDIEGHSRTFANKIDLGAYQHGDGIFANGFEL
ncbi:hypothetical protein ELE36_01020 [Pseudolysobacter antarcticus]|uniref:Right-handed parallel beta-helix repeat-containing protein n=1 Tax=Pseudolysobacter antarcticus TaxID=2511995 RepID=A0A411HF45_9GAMM|nr:hypothetical protein [Pseudolysobacter antarcticus]QBB69074.1 hypothetical protein ELE36_01020 [Pseudolysobacter antarcticus]